MALKEPRWVVAGTEETRAWNGIMREKMPRNSTALTSTIIGTVTGPRCV